LATAQAWLDGMQSAVKARDEQIKHMEEEWQRRQRNAELYASQNLNARRTPGIMTGEPPESMTTNGNKR
jgi:hypothetical protein